MATVQWKDLNKRQRKFLFNKNPEHFDPDSDWWWEAITEDVTSALELIGFYDVVVMFSGFWNQGDGACFTGKYSYKKGSSAAVRDEFPTWTELHELADELARLQRKYFYQIGMTITHSGRYYHEYSTIFDFEDSRHNYGWVCEGFDEDEWRDAAYSFMRDIYKTLKSEWEHLTSEEYVLATEEFDFYEFNLDDLESVESVDECNALGCTKVAWDSQGDAFVFHGEFWAEGENGSEFWEGDGVYFPLLNGRCPGDWETTIVDITTDSGKLLCESLLKL